MKLIPVSNPADFVKDVDPSAGPPLRFVVDVPFSQLSKLDASAKVNIVQDGRKKGGISRGTLRI